jgi:rhamnose transport system permease protein
MPMAVVAPFAIVMGPLLGLFNGVLVATLKLPSLVVTLGTLALYRGLAQVLVGDHPVGRFPRWFNGFDTVRAGGIVPAPLILLLALAVVAGAVLHFITFGRRLYAVGTNESAARFAAIDTARVKLIVFLLSGLSMGVGALMWMSRFRSVDYRTAQGDELAVITAVVLGGTDIFGGRGTIFGTVAAWLLVFVLRTGMDLRMVEPQYQMAITGTLLVVSVILANLTRRLGLRRRAAVTVSPPPPGAQPETSASIKETINA